MNIILKFFIIRYQARILCVFKLGGTPPSSSIILYIMTQNTFIKLLKEYTNIDTEFINIQKIKITLKK